SALVVLANKDLFIDKQGNFGNIFTGDEASAPRYIECRLLPLAKKVLYNPKITEMTDSYDGRNQEPVTFPAKIPVCLIQGSEGIAVGMSTKILPHNFTEVLEAVKAAVDGKQYLLFPDFPTGGYADVSEYNDGTGKVKCRARFDTSDAKRVLIKDLPFSTTTESLISSIESATKKNKIKISSIRDYTTDHVEIEIKLARGVHTDEVVDALYAFTECETTINLNCLVIKEGEPYQATVSDIINYYASSLKKVLKAELEVEKDDLQERAFRRTLERIFVEERLYKKIEKIKTSAGITKTVIEAFKPWRSEVKRDVTQEDVERLLKIPLRRISLYDINKNKQEIKEINDRIKQVNYHLRNLSEYAKDFISGIQEEIGDVKRKTEIVSFDTVNERDAAQRNLKLKYNSQTGYLGYDIKGKSILDVSIYDRILVIRKNGIYFVCDTPEKTFVDKGLLYAGYTDEETTSNTVFTIVYRNKKTGSPHLKRCRIEKFILNKTYSIVPENSKILKLITEPEGIITINYKPKPRIKILSESFEISDFLVKGIKASGVKLANREVKSISFERS
ncbi:MAG: DNA topoisomerase IV subunit A, partial [Chitinivibrionales bacterium]